MNVVNRIVVVFALVVLIPICSVLLLLPLPVLGAVQNQLAGLADALGRLIPWTRVAGGILFALSLDIILVLMVFVEVRRPFRKAIRVDRAAGGDVQISIASISDRLEYEVDQLASVLRSKAKVSARRRGVLVEVDVETASGVNVPEKAEQIVETVRRVAEDEMGLKLARKPKVRLRTIPYPHALKAKARARATTSSPPMVPGEE